MPACMSAMKKFSDCNGHMPRQGWDDAAAATWATWLSSTHARLTRVDPIGLPSQPSEIHVKPIARSRLRATKVTTQRQADKPNGMPWGIAPYRSAIQHWY
jgi:hypothetical protein